jgi:hypothetical protein
MLPKAYKPLEAIFKSIAANREMFADVEFHFIGTGSRSNDENSHTIKPVAEFFGLYQNSVFEYPKRISYIDVLVHLQAADGIFVLGSTEPHYSPSKVYQGILSGRPLLAVLHRESSVLAVINGSRAGQALAFDGEAGLEEIARNFPALFQAWRHAAKGFKQTDVDHTALESYSAQAVTGQLAGLLEKVVPMKR